MPLHVQLETRCCDPLSQLGTQDLVLSTLYSCHLLLSSFSAVFCIVAKFSRRLERQGNFLLQGQLSVTDRLMIAYIALFSALVSRLTAFACGST